MMFRNGNFFNFVDRYIDKNLSLFELSKSYIEAATEDKIFDKTFYFCDNNKKKFLAPIDFFYINEDILDGLNSFPILNPHFCTDIAVYHGDYEADLFIPFFNSLSHNKRVSMIVQKEVLSLGKKKFNVFISQGNNAASISFYSLFMFFVNLYCFDDEQAMEVRSNFEMFLEDKDSGDLFFYFLMAFKDEIDKIKPIFTDLYEEYIDYPYSEDFVNSNRRISFKFNLKYSPTVNLCYSMNIPIISIENIEDRDFPIEFHLDNSSIDFIVKNSINKIIPYSIEFLGRKSLPIVKYASQSSFSGKVPTIDDEKVSLNLNFQRENIYSIFNRYINSRYFENQINENIAQLDKTYKNNVSAIKARNFILEISESLLKNSLMISSLS